MDINELRKQYQEKFNKRPFPGWSEEELQEKLNNEKPDVVSTTTQPNILQDDRISKLEEMVKQLSKDNSNLREETAKLQEGWAEYTPPVSRNKTATVKIYREDMESPAGIITKVKVFKNNALDPETNRYNKLIYSVDLRYDDGTTKEMKIGANELAAIKEIEKVEIVKEDRRNLRKVDDYVPLADRDSKGYPKRVLTGGSPWGVSVGSGQIPIEVFMVKSTVVVRRKNGQEFTMEADYLNI